MLKNCKQAILATDHPYQSRNGPDHIEELQIVVLPKWTWTAPHLWENPIFMSVWVVMIPLGMTMTQTDIKTRFSWRNMELTQTDIKTGFSQGNTELLKPVLARYSSFAVLVLT